MAITVKARVECRSSVCQDDVAHGWRTAQEFFVSLYEFLVTTCSLPLIASNFGRNDAGTLGSGFTIWTGDTITPNTIHCLTNAFFVVRIPFGAWHYYLCVQWNSGACLSGGMTYQNTDFMDASPTVVFNTNYGYYRPGVFIQAAFGTDVGGLEFNPWNGTMGAIGADTKGTPIWKTDPGGSTWVFPRSNNPGGTNDANKNNYMMVQFHNYTGNTNLYARWHFFYSSEGGLVLQSCANERDFVNEFYTTYVGPYTMMTGATANPTPLMMLGWADWNYSGTYHAYIGEWFGRTNEDSVYPMGGIFTPGGGVRPVGLDYLAGQGDYPNVNYLNSPLIESKIPLIVGESTNPGPVGFLDTPLLRMIYGCPPNFGNTGGLRIAHGTGLVVNQWRFTTPWNNNVPGSGTTYSGTEFTVVL